MRVASCLFRSILTLCIGYAVECEGLFNSFGGVHSKAKTTRQSNLPRGMGGYDATVGLDPKAKIQFFALPEKTCPYAARTMIVLEELGLPYETIEIKTQPSKPDWFLNINPRGKVPALQVPAFDNQVIYESAICDEFLCDYATMLDADIVTLMPRDDPAKRAQIRLLNEHCDTVLLKAQFTFLMNKDPEKDEELKNSMESALEDYERKLRDGPGPFLMGEFFSLADVHFLPFMLRLIVSLRHFKNYEIPSSKFQKLLKWYEICSKRNSVQQAAISEEKITEIYERFVSMDYKFGGLNKNK